METTGAREFVRLERIQTLWSGYGEIARYGLSGSEYETVVVKHVKLHGASSHPRGWNSGLSHQRKLKSYQVETIWYEQWSSRCGENCRLPKCLALEADDSEVFMVLEDLDAVGFPQRKTSVNWAAFEACLKWLAHFHVTFLSEKPESLWDAGTYWHLETRPDELEALEDKRLKNAAPAIDRILKESPFQTIVHGDAKLANFCFNRAGDKVAAVDFQYVGGGCGMKDLAYFVGSCFDEDECERLESEILDIYFVHLRDAAKVSDKAVDLDALEENWRILYPIAWTDFHRFLKGWSPGHWKINSYSERIEREVLEAIGI